MDFLFNFNRNYASISYYFRVIASLCRKSPILTYSTSTWRPVGATPFEFRLDGHQKTIVPGLFCGVICLILSLAVSIQYRSVTVPDSRPNTTTAYTALA